MTTRALIDRSDIKPLDDPRAAISIDILRQLMRRGTHAMFKDRQKGESPPDSLYRATAFWDVRDQLFPMLRMRFGGEPHVCSSQLYFCKGEAFVGIPWASPDKRVMEIRLPTLAACGGDEPTWRASWQRLYGVQPHIASAVEGRTNHYLQHVQSIACFGVRTLYGDILFCVDSVREDAFSNAFLTDDALQSVTNFSGLLTHLQHRASTQIDFWNWTLYKFTRSALVPLLWLVIALAGGWARPHLQSLCERIWRDAEYRSIAVLDRYVPQLATTLAAQILLLCLIGFQRPKAEVTLQRQVKYWVLQFYRFWMLAFGVGLASTTLLALQQWAPDGRELFGWLRISLRCIGLLALCACYQALGPRRGAQTSMASIPRWSVVIFTLAAIDVWLTGAQAFTGPLIGCAYALAMAILAGRLQNRLLATPISLIALIQLGAMAEVLSLEQLRGVDLVLQFPASMALFCTTYWAMHSGALERYLERVHGRHPLIPLARLRVSPWRALRLVRQQAAAVDGSDSSER